ncbi:MAG: hypothetical protein ACLRTD_28295 [Bacteroides sp.]
MGPLWDFDIAFGNINYNNNQLATGFWVKEASWIKRLFEDTYFVDKGRNALNILWRGKRIFLCT